MSKHRTNLQWIHFGNVVPMIKLNRYRVHLKPNRTVDREVVKNLSTRILSDEEIDCLAHGLDYGLLPRHFDNMNAVGNIERFFHTVTNIFQNRKKLMKDLRDKDIVINNDICVLNTKEMTLASNLRSLTDPFRFQANRYRKQQHLIHEEQNQYHRLLKQLKEDRSIIVTRPDKGRGIVLLDRDNYISKMNAILNDTTKFRCRSDDPTISRERRLTKILNRLKNDGHISEEFCDMAKSSGSHPGRLYGLPKTHKDNVDKDNVTFRPVLSSIGTYNYGLAKVLKQMLSSILQRETNIKDSFAFVQELKTLKNFATKYKMVSFDITSLYTNIPLGETIKIILNHLYNDQKPPPTISEADLKILLEIATQDSHFLFNGKVYDQIDGVSMGSPLAPLLAEIFLQDFEKNHLPRFKEMDIVYWKRYVDDTFVLLDSEVSPSDICARLSQCHPSVKFTVEEENSTTHTLPFLEVLVERQTGVGFHTRIYRKKTFSGLITKWDSFVPKTYKYNAISTMAYRAIRICSSYPALAEEFEFIRNLSLKNGYPIAFVESIFRRQLNLIYEPRAVTPVALETDTVVLRVPYYGKPSQIYAKRVIAAVTKQYPLKKVRVVYDITARIGLNFTIKDQIPTELKSGVVYETTCPQCKKYIGKTCRHLKTRMNEHLADQRKILNPSAKASDEKISNKPIAPNNHHMTTRSKTRMIQHTSNQRKLLPKPFSLPANTSKQKQTSNETLVAAKVNKAKSQAKRVPSIQHNLEKLDIEEALKNTVIVHKTADNMIPILIRRNEPKLNETDRSVPLYVYPDSIPKTQTNIPHQTPRTSDINMDTGMFITRYSTKTTY